MLLRIALHRFPEGDDTEADCLGTVLSDEMPEDDVIAVGSLLEIDSREFNVYRIESEDGTRTRAWTRDVDGMSLVLFEHKGAGTWYKYIGRCKTDCACVR